ncbi:hypothetical protein [Xanthobacter flavus]|uniref:hypothetical protein n=1 Tax=Xanthobacter flavus TaxID=281 RepID=UPI003727C8F0
MLRTFITQRLAPRLLAISNRRPPSTIIGGEERPYLKRWWLIPRNPLCNVYLHQFLRSDDDRALHDHPWVNLSVLLRGEYTKHTIAAGGVNIRTARRAGDMKARLPSAAHRVELHAGPCWTLFITGPRVRAWGFHCPNGWRDWRVFTNPKDGGRTIGRGCED